MSGIAQLYNIPGTPNESNSWSFSHSSHHRDIIKAIKEQYGVLLPEYVLDPVPVQDLSTWIYQHQQMHNDMNGVLRASGYNLSNVDWKNIESRSSWIFSNATEHTNVAGILRLGPSSLPEIKILLTLRSSSQQQSAPGAFQQTFTFNGLAAGPASGDRYIAICAAAVANVASGITSITINGTAATQLVATNSSVATAAAIYIAFVPSGTTVNVVVTKGANSQNTGVAVGVYSVTGITAPAASNVSSQNNVVSPSAAFDVNMNGAIIGVAVNRALTAAPTANWSGITKNEEAVFAFSGSAVFSRSSSASKNFTEFTSLTVACNFPGGLPQASGCFAVFNP